MSMLKRIKRTQMKRVIVKHGYKPRVAEMKKILDAMTKGLRALSR